MQEQTIPEALSQTPEFILMKAKFPDLKQKSTIPFPYFHRFAPTDPALQSNRSAEIKGKLGENCQGSDLTPYLDVILGQL